MSYNLKIDFKEQYLHVTAKGQCSLTNILGYIDEVYEACLKFRCSKVLIEEHMIGPGLDTFDIFVVITKNYTRAKSIDLRLAYIDVNPEHNMQGMKFAENLAHIRGVKVRFFTELNNQEMVDWLLKKETN